MESTDSRESRKSTGQWRSTYGARRGRNSGGSDCIHCHHVVFLLVPRVTVL